MLILVWAKFSQNRWRRFCENRQIVLKPDHTFQLWSTNDRHHSKNPTSHTFLLRFDSLWFKYHFCIRYFAGHCDGLFRHCPSKLGLYYKQSPGWHIQCIPFGIIVLQTACSNLAICITNIFNARTRIFAVLERRFNIISGSFTTLIFLSLFEERIKWPFYGLINGPMQDRNFIETVSNRSHFEILTFLISQIEYNILYFDAMLGIFLLIIWHLPPFVYINTRLSHVTSFLLFFMLRFGTYLPSSGNLRITHVRSSIH